MKSRFMKMLTLVLTICLLMCCLTGCEELSYREAVQRYNARQYEKAAELFSELGDYQDSKTLFRDSHYWAAMDLMDAGDYASAWPRFHKLGDHRDSADRAVECKYQMAIAAFEADEFDTAERYFLEAPEYRQTPEYLRQLSWQKLYDYVLTNGTEGSDGFVLTQISGNSAVDFVADLAQPGKLTMISCWEKDMGYLFSDQLQLVLPRDSTTAAFTAHSGFHMDFGDGKIGTEQTGTGSVDLAAYTPGQVLPLETFYMTGTDNLGNSISSQDPANNRLDDAVAGHMSVILDCLTTLQAVVGVENIY